MSMSGLEAGTAVSQKDVTERFNLLPITSDEALENIKSFSSEVDETVLICSYPKSGTTWLQNIVFQLLKPDDLELTHISHFSPFFESDKTWQGMDQTVQNHKKLGKNVFNTHLWPEMLPETTGTKYIYVTRNPQDVCYSFFKHLSNQDPKDGGYTGSFEVFVDEFLSGSLPFGPWKTHIEKWTKFASNNGRVLWLTYEDMKNNLGVDIQRVQDFLGTSKNLVGVVESSSFDYMKRNIKLYEPLSVRWKKKDEDFAFIRSGSVGDGAQHMTETQKSKFSEMLKKS